MDWQMLQAVAESLGTAGVIISLLYLAAQVRMGARATRLATAHEFNSASREFFALLSANPEALRIWRRGLVDPESLTQEEAMRLSTLLLHSTTLWEEPYYAIGDKDVPLWAKHFSAHGASRDRGSTGIRKVVRGAWRVVEPCIPGSAPGGDAEGVNSACVILCAEGD